MWSPHPTTTPLDKDNRIYTMRNAVPYWAKGGAIKTPDGKSGTAIAPDGADKNTEIDNDTQYVAVSERYAQPIITNTIFGLKKKRTIYADHSIMIAGSGWKIYAITIPA